MKAIISEFFHVRKHQFLVLVPQGCLCGLAMPVLLFSPLSTRCFLLVCQKSDDNPDFTLLWRVVSFLLTKLAVYENASAFNHPSGALPDTLLVVKVDFHIHLKGEALGSFVFVCCSLSSFRAFCCAHWVSSASHPYAYSCVWF